MDQQRVQVIKVKTVSPSFLHRIFFIITFVKITAEASEKRGHRDIGFPVSVTDGRVDQGCGSVVANDIVSVPEIAMNKRWGLRGKEL